MKIDDFQRMVRILSNQCYVRYWLNLYYPQASDHYVLSCIEIDGNLKAHDAQLYEKDLDFDYKEVRDGLTYYFFKKEI